MTRKRSHKYKSRLLRKQKKKAAWEAKMAKEGKAATKNKRDPAQQSGNKAERKLARSENKSVKARNSMHEQRR